MRLADMNVVSLVLATFLSAPACSTAPAKNDGGQIDLDGGDIGGGHEAGIDTGLTDGVGNSDTSASDLGDSGRQALCDGVQHLRLLVLIRMGSEPRGSIVRVENGHPVIAIDGTCSYWIGGGWTEDALSRDRPFRTGRMSEADVRAVEESLPIDDVAALADCPPPPAGLFDYSIRDIRSETMMASCIGSAPELTAGTRFEAAWMTVQAIAGKLWDDGMPMDGALHVSAVEASSNASATPAPYAWPNALPLGPFILSSSDWFKSGVSRLVDDPGSARQLRAMRDQYLADRTAQPGLYGNWDGLMASDQSSTVFVYMRDAIPYEDARGWLTF